MINKSVAIIDYGMGNLRSVQNAVAEVGYESDFVTDPENLLKYDRLILPGVGSFGDAIENLRAIGMDEALNNYKRTGRWLLGICLGAQLMCQSSSENGDNKGLGWFNAHVRPFSSKHGIRVPHMGWNEVHNCREHHVTNGLRSGCDVYFVHSYYIKCETPNEILGETIYGDRFASMIARDNLIGMQFHPEKSQHIGLALLKNFLQH